MGPPAPTPRHEAAVRHEGNPRARAAAEAAWPWYAGAWAIDVGTTAIALSRPGTSERGGIVPGVPMGERPTLLSAGKAAVGLAAWRAEVWLADLGHVGLSRVLRWFFVGAGFGAGAWNLSLAW